jgi:RNA-directed DNA polymerase
VILDKIAANLVLPRDYLWRVVWSASHRYKTYTIPKRTGGVRTINHPARELKLLQYWVLDNVCSRLRVHDAATAYRSGRNIRDHAAIHVRQSYLLKVDFRDFFPSIRRTDVLRVLGEHVEVLTGVLEGDPDRELVCRIVCKGDQLTIGAPTSPTLSNAVMFDFDTRWAARSRELGVVYSRYADDLYFSTSTANILSGLLAELRQDLQERVSPRLFINNEKTAFGSRKRSRLVTGLVLTPEFRISMGRDRKRLMKSLVFSFLRGGLTKQQADSLRGLIAYARSVEPSFVETLRNKYGARIRDLL